MAAHSRKDPHKLIICLYVYPSHFLLVSFCLNSNYKVEQYFVDPGKFFSFFCSFSRLAQARHFGEKSGKKSRDNLRLIILLVSGQSCEQYYYYAALIEICLVIRASIKKDFTILNLLGNIELE